MIKPEYVELEFAMPFYEMYFPDTWNDNKLAQNPFELIELSAQLNIEIDTEFLFNEYERTQNQKDDIYIFYPSDRKDIFIYFDLRKDKYDQMAMVVVGVRIKTVDKRAAKQILEKLYFKSTTRSDLQEDYFNQTLFKVATNNVQDQKRNVRHYINGNQV
jgi:hypothetical protein